MRTISVSLSEKLQNPIQTKAQDSDLSFFAKISRGTTVLASNKHLEKIKIADGTGTGTITDVSVAVEHSKLGGVDGAIWACMVDGGRLSVFRSSPVSALGKTSFTELDCAESAVSCSVCFDGDYAGNREFLTDSVPYIFWIDSGVLYGKLWTDAEATVISASGNSRVSAVRPLYDTQDNDRGLVVFYLKTDGTLYYRQKIGDQWLDEEIIQFHEFGGDTAVAFTDIAAFRTWDYRVGLQAISESGDIYDLFSYHQNETEDIEEAAFTENLSITGITVTGSLHG